MLSLNGVKSCHFADWPMADPDGGEGGSSPCQIFMVKDNSSCSGSELFLYVDNRWHIMHVLDALYAGGIMESSCSLRVAAIFPVDHSITNPLICENLEKYPPS